MMKTGMKFYGTKKEGDGKLMSRSEFRKAKKEAKMVGKVAKQQAKLEELRKPKDISTAREKVEQLSGIGGAIGGAVTAIGGIVQQIKNRRKPE